MKKMTSATFSMMFAGAALATACTLVPSVVLPMVNIPSMASQQARVDAIADHISQFLGSARSSEIPVVRIPTRTCLLGVCGVSDVVFYKPCGEGAAEAYRRIHGEAGSGSGGGVGDGGGGASGTGGGWGGIGIGGGGCFGRGCFGVVGPIRPK